MNYFLTLVELRTGMTDDVLGVIFGITSIIDCTEFKIETTRNPDIAKKCYSSYKHAYTNKILIGVETDGNVAFLSHAFMGGISDIAIVKVCGLLNRLEEGSVVLEDRGFQLVDVARDHGICWVVPPSAPTSRGFKEREMTETYKIAQEPVFLWKEPLVAYVF